MKKMLPFLLIALSIWLAAHWVIFVYLRELAFPSFITAVGLFLLALSFPLARILEAKQQHRWAIPLNWLGNYWMGLGMYLFFWLSATGVLRWLLVTLLQQSVLGEWLLWGGLMGALVCFGIAVLQGFYRPRVKQYTIDHSARHQMGKQMRIVQLSDIHLGYILGSNFLDTIVKSVQALNPDLIVITGDVIDPDAPGEKELIPIFNKFSAPQGVYAITGNHEFYSGVPRFLSLMQGSGIKVLENDRVDLPNGTQLAGIHDRSANHMLQSGYRSDLTKAVKNWDIHRPGFVLAHQPKKFEAALEKWVDLIFSGHTHKGQIIPFNLVVKRVFKHIYGLVTLSAHTKLIISSGTGFWGPPLRLGSRNEIVQVDFLY